MPVAVKAIGDPLAHRPPGRPSLIRVVALLAALNLVLGAALLAVRPPGRVVDEVAPPPELPAPVQALMAQIDQGRSGTPYTLNLSDDDLTAMVGYFLARSPNIPFTQVRVTVSDRAVSAEGVTRGLAVRLPVRVVGSVGARNGLPLARVENVSLGDTALPAFVRDQVVREVNASLDFSRYSMPVAVDALELRPGGMAVRGTIKGRG
ncbi:MAG: hypothetical protein HY690_01950 [Chloroflexi bacterium]|nr:hypothetical protein [Chloroflexota bacterium]